MDAFFLRGIEMGNTHAQYMKTGPKHADNILSLGKIIK